MTKTLKVQTKLFDNERNKIKNENSFKAFLTENNFYQNLSPILEEIDLKVENDSAPKTGSNVKKVNRIKRGLSRNRNAAARKTNRKRISKQRQGTINSSHSLSHERHSEISFQNGEKKEN